MAITPVYGVEQGGNCTRIYLSSGDVITDSRKTKTVLQNIARYFGANPKVLQSNYGKIYNCKLKCPYAFSKNHIYVPVKVRSPLVKTDGATGYFNYAAFEGLEIVTPDSADHRAKCIILLSGEHRITTHYSPANIKERINLARGCQERYCHLHEELSFASKSPGSIKKDSTKLIKIDKGLYFKLMTDDDDDDDDDDGNGGSGSLLN